MSKKRGQLNKILAAFGLPEYEKLEQERAKWTGNRLVPKPKAGHHVIGVAVKEVPAKPKLLRRVKNIFTSKSSEDIVDDFFKKS